MSWWEETIRGLLAVPTGGLSEVVGRKNQLGRTVTGGLEGGAGGFVTGGPVGAAMGAGTGMGLSGTGTTDPYSLKGGAINAGSGAGAGSLPSFAGMMGSGSGAAGMSPYMPTSTPNMGMAGSTMGGGMGSPLNLGPTSGMAQAPMASGGTSALSKALQAMRMMPSGGMSGGSQQSPQQSDQSMISRIYQMYPSLRPGSRMGFGG